MNQVFFKSEILNRSFQYLTEPTWWNPTQSTTPRYALDHLPSGLLLLPLARCFPNPHQNLVSKKKSPPKPSPLRRPPTHRRADILPLPPDDSACLVRASLVCKLWRSIISDPTFPGRHCDFHRVPRLLGFFHNLDCGSNSIARFVPMAAAAASPFPKPEPDPRGWRVLDCHHGRVLLRDMGSRKFAVWDPVTGRREELHGPGISYKYMSYSAAVLCSADGCDHLHCHGGPYLVVLVCPDYTAGFTRACVYSSRSDAWGAPASVDSGANYFDTYRKRGAVVGDEIYFILGIGARNVRYDVGKHCLSMIDPPDNYGEDTVLMPMEDGSLGLAGSRNSKIYLWSRKVNSDGFARWVRCRVMDVEKLIPAFKSGTQARVVGFAEGVGVIFARNSAGTFTIQLSSGRVRQVNELFDFAVFPFLSFYST